MKTILNGGRMFPTIIMLTENDAAEIEKFRLYLTAIARWDNAHDDLPDFAPITEMERMIHMKKRIKAHAAIYEQIYGEQP